MQDDQRNSLNDLNLIQRDIDPDANPLDFIADDHLRERAACALIDRMVASGTPDERICTQVAGFLTTQLPHHLADEEIDLFPLMIERCPPEDEIHQVIARLLADHGYTRTDRTVIIALLGKRSGYTPPQAAQMAAFAAHVRRHLIVENAIILPIARARLTETDLITMNRHMRDRRRITPPDAPEPV